MRSKDLCGVRRVFEQTRMMVAEKAYCGDLRLRGAGSPPISAAISSCWFLHKFVMKRNCSLLSLAWAFI
jgi:hypothetical protein